MKREYLIVTAFLLIFFSLCTYSITVKSITNDELTHIASGYSYIHEGDFRMNPEHPPLIKEIAAIPLLLRP